MTSLAQNLLLLLLRSSSCTSSNPLNKHGRIASRGHLTKVISRRYVFSMISFKQMRIYKMRGFLTLLYHTSATSLHLEGLDVTNVFY